MKLSGVDFGTKKVGIAFSDESGKLAFPHSVLVNDEDLFEKISDICAEKKVEKIILGKPEGYKSGDGKILKQIENFRSVLENETKLPVEYENEVLTTAQAGRLQGLHEKIDASSAALILQSYLDRLNKISN